MRTDPPSLPDPPFYFPLRHGRYDVAPGLCRFGKDLGGGQADANVFQFDNTFPRFRAAKIAARYDRSDCIVASNLETEVARTAASFIIGRLTADWRNLFSLNRNARTALLQCHLTGDELPLDVDNDAEGVLGALGSQIQEDFAIVNTAGKSQSSPEWLSFAHVCLPNGWAPSEKIGRSFAQIHQPVTGMAEMNRRGREFADLMTRAADGLVRFAWGIAFDDVLDHHPARPRAAFDPNSPTAFLRVERQTIWGFPDVNAALFTIRTYFYDIDTFRRDSATSDPLLSALRTMPSESVAYKGLAPCLDQLISWIVGSVS